MTVALALDLGFGNTKLYGGGGGVVLQSAVSVAASKEIHRMIGLRASNPPLRVASEAGEFYVGEGAHDWGRPVENLELDRLTGSPETLALFLGAATRYGEPSEAISLMVGLPIGLLMDADAKSAQRAVRGFLCGRFAWAADGLEHLMEVSRVRITSQPVGAMFDYLLSDDGTMPQDRRRASRGEIGVLGVGMNTVEVLAISNGKAVQRFTAGETLGVRRLLELVNHNGLYSLAEADGLLRSGALDTRAALRVWESEVLGFVERQWGASHRRFEVVVAVGGGACLLREALLRRFKEKVFVPDDPILATARGLYKYTAMQARRRRT